MKHYTQIAVHFLTSVLAAVALAFLFGVFARVLVGAFCLGYGCK
jgi:hypothetical protein